VPIKNFKKYQYQQQTADPEHVYRDTLLGKALVKSLQEMKQRGLIAESSKYADFILDKFDAAFREQFDQISQMAGADNCGNELNSLSQNVDNESSMCNITSLNGGGNNSHNSYNSSGGYLAPFQGA